MKSLHPAGLPKGSWLGDCAGTVPMVPAVAGKAPKTGMAATLGLLLVRHVFRQVEPGPTQTKDVKIGHSAPPLLCTIRFACPATPRLTPKPCHPWLGSCLGSDGPSSSVTPATVLHRH